MTSSSTAHRKDTNKNRFISPWLLGVSFVAVVLIFIIIFPKQRFIHDIEKADQNDKLAPFYLRTLIKEKNTAPEIRLELVNQEILAGNISSAKLLLQSFLQENPSTQSQWQAEFLLYKILKIKTYSFAESTTLRTIYQQRLVDKINELATAPLKVSQLKTLVLDALSLDQKEIAYKFQQEVLKKDPEQESEFYVLSAKIMIDLNNYESAADYYFKAQDVAKTYDDQHRYFLIALRTLQADNQLDKALIAAKKHIHNLSDDPDILQYLINLARSANQDEIAEFYMKQRLYKDNVLVPYNPDLYELAYNIFLINSNHNDAIIIANKAAQDVTDNILWIKRLAQLALWNNQPEVVLTQWLILAEKTSDITIIDRAIKLAKDIFHYQILEKIEKLKLMQQPSEENWKRYIETLKNTYQIDKAISELNIAIEKKPSIFHYKLLAELHYSIDQLEQASETLKQIEKHQELTPEVALERAKLMYINNDIQGAYRILKKVKVTINNNLTEYWQTLGDLSWLTLNDNQAKIAYRKLFQEKKINETSLLRLIILNWQTNKKIALEGSKYGWQKFKTPIFFLYAVDLASQQQQWDFLAQYYKTLSSTQEKLLQYYDDFWIVKIKIALAEFDREGAKDIYRHALSVLPSRNKVKETYAIRFPELQIKPKSVGSIQNASPKIKN